MADCIEKSPKMPAPIITKAVAVRIAVRLTVLLSIRIISA
jgi:hypothetical protein